MTAPLVVLAGLSLAGGFIPVPGFLEPLYPAGEAHHDFSLVAISVAAGLIGIAIAYTFYVLRPGLAGALAGKLGVVYRLVYNKYFVDEVYDATVVRPVVQGSRFVLWRGIDVGVVDGIVNGIGYRAKDVGNILRLFQSGNIRSYAAWVLLGSVLVLVAIGVAGGAR